MTESNTRAGAILREAAGIVDGARNQTHGDKERSFIAIAKTWDAYLASRRAGREGVVTAADVAAMMVMLKLMRSEHGQHVEDHGVDAAGYSAIWGELREAAANAEKPVSPLRRQPESVWPWKAVQGEVRGHGPTLSLQD